MPTLDEFNFDNTDAFCTSCGINHDNFKDFLNYIGGPKSLNRFNFVIHSLNQVNNYLNGYKIFHSSNESIQYIISNLQNIEHFVEKCDKKQPWSLKGISRPLNLVTLFPEYAMLASPKKEYPKEWGKLKWQLTWFVFSVSMAYRQNMQSQNLQVNTGIGRATREIRKLENKAKRPKVLPPELMKNETIEMYAKKFINHIDAQDKNDWGKGIRLLCQSFLDEKQRITRIVDTRNRKKKSYSSIEYEDVSPELPNTPKAISILKSQSKLDADDIEEEGLSVDELTSNNFICIKEKNNQPSKIFSARKYKQIQRGRINSIKSTNQHLAHSWQTLSPHEIATFFRSIDQKTDGTEYWCQNFHGLRALLLVLVWSGRPFAEVASMGCFKSTKYWHLNSPFSIAWLKDEKLLGVKVYGPEYKSNTVNKLMSFGEHKNTPYLAVGFLYLKLPPIATKHIQKWADSINTKKMFIEDESNLLKDAELLIHKLSQLEHSDIRLSLGRLQRLMSTALKAVGASLADILLITNRAITHAETSLRYYQTQPSQLATFHSHACEWITSFTTGNISKKVLEKDKNTWDIANQNNCIIGAKFRMNPELLILIVKDLRQKLNKSRYAFENASMDQKRTALIDYHNHFTLYTVSFLQFVSGYRAVTDPLSNLNLIDFQTSIMCLSDKDDQTYSQSRIIMLPSEFIEQLVAYVTHLEALKSLNLNAELVETIKSILDKSKENRKVGVLFFLNEDAHPEAVSPKTIRNFTHHNLPSNIQRHYLRTELQKLGVDPEFISYFMGHWDIGEEPHQRYSTVSPLSICKVLSPAIATLVKKAGWSVQWGLRG